MIKSTDFKNLEKLIQKNEIRTYHLRAIAQRYAKERNWNRKDVVLVERDLDRQWIIAREKGDCLECLLWHDIGSVKLEKEAGWGYLR